MKACEQLAQYGAKGIAEFTLFECVGIPEYAAKELLSKADHSLGNIAKMPLTEIAGIKGIGLARAAAIAATLEIGRRRATESAITKNHITSSLDCYELLHAHMRDLTEEHFVVIFLDRRSKVIKIETVFMGGMSAMTVDPKVVFQKSLQYRSSSIILSHNHPSGAAQPSIEDIRLTEKMKLAGQYIDIKVLDHIIIGDGSYYSFADEGKI